MEAAAGAAAPGEGVLGGAKPMGSLMVLEAGSGCMADSVVAMGSWAWVSVSTGSLASRNAYSGSVVVGSSLSLLRVVLVLKALRKDLVAGSCARFDKPLGLVRGVATLRAACLQAPQTNRDGTDILAVSERDCW